MYICWRGFCIAVRYTTMRITEVDLTKKQRVKLEYIEHFDPGRSCRNGVR